MLCNVVSPSVTVVTCDQESDNPDLRDRGYIYWRLLLTDPAAAKVSLSHSVTQCHSLTPIMSACQWLSGTT